MLTEGVPTLIDVQHCQGSSPMPHITLASEELSIVSLSDSSIQFMSSFIMLTNNYCPSYWSPSIHWESLYPDDVSSTGSGDTVPGSALGPDWAEGLDMQGISQVWHIATGPGFSYGS